LHLKWQFDYLGLVWLVELIFTPEPVGFDVVKLEDIGCPSTKLKKLGPDKNNEPMVSMIGRIDIDWIVFNIEFR
jgi:hypothetical protein